jgi:uncharacterized protein YraI
MLKTTNHTQIQRRNYFRNLSVLLTLFVLILASCAPATTPTQSPPAATAPDQSGAGQDDPSYYPDEPVAILPTPAAGSPTVTASYNTTIRSGPGTNYPVYGAFLGGTTAQAVGKSADGQWWAVSVPVAATGQGWVSAAWALVSNADNLPVLPAPPVPPTVAFTPPGPDDPQATALTEVYIRTGPGDQYPAYGVALKGSNGGVIGKSTDGQWWVVRINPEVVGAGHGWVLAAYTQAKNVDTVPQVQAPPPSNPVTVPPPPSGAAAATALDYVNLRSGPGLNYPVLGVAAPGATGEVSGKSQDAQWWQVKVPATGSSPEGVAWVSTSWVSTQNTESVPEVPAPAPPPAISPTQVPPDAAQCALVAQSPADGTVVTPDSAFVMSWTLKNTSSTAWDMAEADLNFLGAQNDVRLHLGGDVYDLSKTVNPGDTYEVTLDAIAPSSSGSYGEAWAIVTGKTTLCPFWLLIQVQ